MHKKENNLISIIIPTKNSQTTLKKCLESVMRQTYKNIEIVVVDNYSKDKTKEIALQYTRLFFQKGKERSAQRNYGIQKSKGNYLLFLDSDMILSQTVIEEGIKKLTINKNIIGLYIPEIIIGHTFWTKVRNFERGFYNKTVIDCVRLVRKKEVLQINGFDEALYSAEDWDFQKRLNKYGNSNIIKSPLYHNEDNFSFFNYITKKKYYIQGLQRYKIKWGNNDPDIKKQFSFIYRYFGIFIEKNKWKHLLFHPILTICMYFLRIMIGYHYLRYEKK